MQDDDRSPLSDGGDSAPNSNAQTLTNWWARLDLKTAEKWTARAEQAVKLLGPQRSIVDLGCGHMHLEPLLPPGTQYIPADCVRRDERTVVVDLNREPVPALDSTAITVLGVLEYINDVLATLEQLFERYRTVIVTYNVRELRAQKERPTWVNNYSAAELEAMFVAVGFRIEVTEDVSVTQKMWRLTSNGGSR